MKTAISHQSSVISAQNRDEDLGDIHALLRLQRQWRAARRARMRGRCLRLLKLALGAVALLPAVAVWCPTDAVLAWCGAILVTAATSLVAGLLSHTEH